MSQSPVPRIDRLSVEDAREIAAANEIPEQMAELSVFRVLLHHPRLAKALTGLLTTLLFQARLDSRLRELVILRLGWTTGSEYEWTQHWRVARDLGVSEEDGLGVRDWHHHAAFGPAERAVLAATDETVANGTISAATWSLLEAHLETPEERLELVAAIGNWRLFSSLLRSLEIPLEEGVTPWPPDGKTPS